MAGVIAFAAAGGCSSAQQPSAAAAPAPSVPANAADAKFMSDMIRHHAQAVVMAQWAPSRGASAALLRLCERILVAQTDEIAFMKHWLNDRKLPIPDSAAHHHELMPGMLTTEQLRTLDAARGPEFDRLFLTFMIQHHEGALTMVEQLFNTSGGAQDPIVFKFAADVSADQTAEIDRMSALLGTMSQ